MNRPRGCYELWLGNGSILAWLLENHIQATLQTKSEPLSLRTWRLFEKTLHNAATSCARQPTVYDVLSYLASSMSHEELLADFPYLEEEDIRASLAFAADLDRRLIAVLPL